MNDSNAFFKISYLEAGYLAQKRAWGVDGWVNESSSSEKPIDFTPVLTIQAINRPFLLNPDSAPSELPRESPYHKYATKS